MFASAPLSPSVKSPKSLIDLESSYLNYQIHGSSSFSRHLSTPVIFPSPGQNCTWFQKEKYRLTSVDSEMERKADPQITFNSSLQTENTQNCSSRPSNQFSYLSSQSSWPRLESSSVAHLETRKKTNPFKPVNQPLSAGSALHSLQCGVSSHLALHPQTSVDCSAGISHPENRTHNKSANTLALLHSDFARDESSLPLSSDLYPFLSTNNSASQHSNDSMGEDEESLPQPQGTLLSDRNSHLRSPFKFRMLFHSSKSPIELQACSSTKSNLKKGLAEVSSSPLSTLTRLRSESIPPTPVSCRSIGKPDLLTQINLINPSQSLPVVIPSDKAEQTETNKSLDTQPLESSVFYSMRAFCGAAGGPESSPHNVNAVSYAKSLH